MSGSKELAQASRSAWNNILDLGTLITSDPSNLYDYEFSNTSEMFN